MGSRPSTLRDTVTSDARFLVDPNRIQFETSPRSDEADDVHLYSKFNNESDLQGPILVIGIDFGTAYSGYAFSFKGNKGKVMTVTTNQCLGEDRIPTVVLLNPDKSFNSFGFDAQETYSKLGDKKDSYFYCEHFKMSLFESMKSSNNAEIKDNQNRTIDAKGVVVMLIENILHLAFEIVCKLRKEDITWIITLPARWTKSAKHILRQSALAAGIDDNSLRFVQESYAAILHCMQLGVSTDNQPLSYRDRVGKRYMLADLGGESAEVCVYEVEGEKKLKELQETSKEGVGGLSVDHRFKGLMESLVGPTIWSDFKERYTPSFQNFVRDFERKKRTFSCETATITMSVENSLLEVLGRETGNSLDHVIKNSSFADKIRFKPMFNKILFDKEVMEEFFKPSVDGIISLLEDTLDACQDLNIDTIFFVGGYSESPYLQEQIKSKFSRENVAFHHDAKLAVLKGALMLGHQRNGSENLDVTA